MKSDKRISEIDIIKALAIIGMVLGHAGAPFTHFIYLFHMAVFFIASGFVYKNVSTGKIKDIWRFVLKKINLPLKERVANDCLRYSIWKEKNGSYPGYLDDDDIQPILESNCVFARKVNTTHSSNLIDTLFDKHEDK